MSEVRWLRHAGEWFVWALTLSLPTMAQAAFVMDVNGLFEDVRAVNGFPTSTLTITNNYPDTAIIDDQDLGEMYTSYANRHDLLFSTDGGSTRRAFSTNGSFDISVDLKLDATAVSPRKEAGLRINYFGYDGQFIVNSDAGEIVAFGGGHPFFSFNTDFGLSYTTGSSINLRMIYNAPTATAAAPLLGDYNEDYSIDAADYTVWRDTLSAGGTELPNDPTEGTVDESDYAYWKAHFGDSGGTIEYRVVYGGQEYTSGPISYTNVELGILDGSFVGVYAQGAAAPGNPGDDFTATFTNFVWGDGSVGGGSASGLAVGAVPEPATIWLAAFAVLGILGTVRRRGHA